MDVDVGLGYQLRARNIRGEDMGVMDGWMDGWMDG